MKPLTTTVGLLILGATLALSVGGCGGIIDEEAEALLYERLGQTSITVFPTFVREGQQQRYDPNAARAIGEFLTQEELATVTVSAAEVPITSQWGMNQAKMFRRSAADFSAYVRANPPESDYALLSECLIGGRGVVVGVHLYLVDAEGAVACAFLCNSHHKVFSDVNPKTVDDATIIVINKLRETLAPARHGSY